MPYKDKERAREYQRDYKRLKRGGESITPCQTHLPTEFRFRTAEDIVNLLAEQVGKVKEDKEAKTLEKARTIGYLAGIALRAIETLDISQRVEAWEEIMQRRKYGNKKSSL